MTPYFEISSEHQLLRQSVRQMLDRHAQDDMVSKWDTTRTFPEHVYRMLADLGVCGLTFDQHGGSGADYIALCIVVEELARTSAALAWAYLTTVSVGARAVAHYGTASQQAKILPGIADGDVRIAVALTEPGAGSDLGALSTTAVHAGPDLIVTGQKVFTTGADSASWLLTLVRTGAKGRLRDGMTFVLIRPDSPGVAIRPLPKMAGQALHTCEVFFDGVRVPAADALGPIGGAARILFAALESERVATAAMGLGIAAGALDKALGYAQVRQQFGEAIISKQAVGHLIADMAIDVDTARLLTYRAASLLQDGQPCGRESAIAKVAASEIGTRCANRGMQILGGYSYMLEYGMERYWRESKLYEIAAGTNQILRDAIVKHLNGQLSGR